MSYAALGQLGGLWGWYSVWEKSPPVNGYAAATEFAAWMWTDRGTAEYFARRAYGQIRHQGGLYRSHDYWVDQKMGAGVAADYRWREMKAGWWPSSPHTSWVYTTSKAARALNETLASSYESMCFEAEFCTEIRDVTGNIVS